MKSICTSLAALAVLALLPTAHAGDGFPFRAHGSATGTAVPQDEHTVDIHFDILLIATYLGRSTGEAHYVLKIPELTFTGTFTATAPSGNNSLSFSAEGQLTSTEDGCLFDIDQTFTVTGGTGVLAGATGSGTSTGLFDMCSTSVVETTFDGTITRPLTGR